MLISFFQGEVMKDSKWDEIPTRIEKPNFDNLLSVLHREAPAHATLFEYLMNEPLYNRLSPELSKYSADPLIYYRKVIAAFYRLGYDYAVVGIPGFSFSAVANINRRIEKSMSLDEGSVLHTREDVNNFPWPNPDLADYGILDRLKEYIPEGMKLIVHGPLGLLENVVNLVGVEGACFMIKDDRKLAEDIFEKVGSRLVRFYDRVAQHECVGATISNDDWGFKTHTFFRPEDMRHFIFPWHKQIVEAVHGAGKPTILHSCGHFQNIVDDIVEDMKYDGRHSYEDNIMTVEEAYETYHDRIAILGGIDIDFISRSNPEEIYQRSRAMLDRTRRRGGYALGTGNSVPEYIPDKNYFALIKAALDQW
jgi:uroporphyrinogen decarboxylase